MSERGWLAVLVAGCIGLVAAIAIREAVNPCVKYEVRHPDYTWIGTSVKGDPVYGPGDERVCIRREKR